MNQIGPKGGVRCSCFVHTTDVCIIRSPPIIITGCSAPEISTDRLGQVFLRAPWVRFVGSCKCSSPRGDTAAPVHHRCPRRCRQLPRGRTEACQQAPEEEQCATSILIGGGGLEPPIAANTPLYVCSVIIQFLIYYYFPAISSTTTSTSTFPMWLECSMIELALRLYVIYNG